MTTFSTPGCTPSQKATGRCDSVKWKSKLKKKRAQDPGNRDTKTEKCVGGGGESQEDSEEKSQENNYVSNTRYLKRAKFQIGEDRVLLRSGAKKRKMK